MPLFGAFFGPKTLFARAFFVKTIRFSEVFFCRNLGEGGGEEGGGRILGCALTPPAGGEILAQARNELEDAQEKRSRALVFSLALRA